MRSEAQQEHTRGLAAKNLAIKEAVNDAAAKRAASKARVAAQRAAEQHLIDVAREVQPRLKREAAERRARRTA